MIRTTRTHAQLQCNGCHSYEPMIAYGPGYRRALERLAARRGWQVTFNGLPGGELVWCWECKPQEVRV